MTLREFRISFSATPRFVAVNTEMITHLNSISSGTRIYLTGSHECYVDVKETYEEAMKVLWEVSK